MARVFAGPVMALAGLNHFLNPAFYERIVPPGLPATEALVYGSGVAEIAGALGTLHPRTRRAAGWFLIATLVAVYPANIYMAVEADRFSDIPRWALLARLPLQFLFVYWVWVATLRRDERGERGVAATG
ncbi:MAG TPA: DoxX family membrane protein [Actinomycetota bacterium]|nr:DoxX family membrane protein [Actinomycetota bacterium]